MGNSWAGQANSSALVIVIVEGHRGGSRRHRLRVMVHNEPTLSDGGRPVYTGAMDVAPTLAENG